MNADKETGIIKDKYFHKNELFNLTTLCHNCHSKVTAGTILVHGYRTSLNGTFLDYNYIEDSSWRFFLKIFSKKIGDLGV